MSISKNAQAFVDSRYRTRELSGDRRAGAWSRREVRKAQVAWLRKHRRIVAWLALGLTIACGLIDRLFPPSISNYLVGGLIVSAFWWTHCLMITRGGLASKLAGISAEVSTATELRRLSGSGWRLANHVMLEHRDVDHVVLGPGGFFAVETKFRASWLQHDLARYGAAAREAADDVWLRLGLPLTRVRALVVLWGGGISEMFPEPFEIDGVTFCTGVGLTTYFRTLAVDEIPDTEVARAYKKLESNMRRRDRREIEVQGEIPRQAIDSVEDFLASALSATAALLLIAWSMTVLPSILWGVPAAAVIVGVAVWLRRMLPRSQRAQLVTTAVVTAACYLAALVLVVWLVDLVPR